jgi:hypothetical protein
MPASLFQGIEFFCHPPTWVIPRPASALVPNYRPGYAKIGHGEASLDPKNAGLGKS